LKTVVKIDRVQTWKHKSA